MSFHNSVRLLGNVGSDPEVRYHPNGTVQATFRMATTENWKDKQTGQWQQETTWHTVTCWGEIAKAIERKLRKGSLISIEGRIQNDSWSDDKGKHYKSQIKMEQYHIHTGEKNDSD